MDEMPANAARDETSPADGCAAALRALGTGDLRRWHGVAAGCGRSAAEAAFGPSEAGPDGSAMLAGFLTAFRHFPAAPAAPHGLVVWFEEDEILIVEIVELAVSAPVQEQLGSPEGTARSGLGLFYRQWVYASRGLTLHVHEHLGTVHRLYAYAPTTVDEFLRSPLAGVEEHRVPLRE